MVRRMIRRLIAVVLLAALSLGVAVSGSVAGTAVCFTPGQDCTDKIVVELRNARRSILVQAYSFTSAPIARALVAANNRGVDVRAILDISQRSERYSSATFLANAGVSVWIDAGHAIAHNKVMVIDGETVITGSFNFTKAAQEKNAENLLVMRDRALAERYTANWQMHLGHAEPYPARLDSPRPGTR